MLTNSKKLLTILMAVLLLVSMLVFLYCFKDYGHLNVRVVDAYTLMPLKGAKVIIPDVHMAAESDNTGSCVFTGIPIRKNILHYRLIQYDWGECTIIATAAGYRPTVILNTRVDKDKMRSGPTVYMFPEEQDDIPVAPIVESPDMEWIIKLVEKYSR